MAEASSSLLPDTPHPSDSKPEQDTDLQSKTRRILTTCFVTTSWYFVSFVGVREMLHNDSLTREASLGQAGERGMAGRARGPPGLGYTHVISQTAYIQQHYMITCV